MKKIFISHSSEDLEFVYNIISLLEAIGFKSDEIFCTSVTGYGCAFGEDFLERIKNELNSDITVVFVLSDNFYNSSVCMCEMGAAWIKKAHHVQILIPPFDFDDIKGVLLHSHGFKITDPDAWSKLKDQLCRRFEIDCGANTSTIWEVKRNNILSSINVSIEKREQQSINSEMENITKQSDFDNTDFELGDRVKLKSGGSPMTIKYISGGKINIEEYEDIAIRNNYVGKILCTWNQGDKWFEPYLLTKC